MPSTRPTTPTRPAEAPASATPNTPTTPSAHSTEALCDLKSRRAHEHRRKMTLKGGEWKTKQHARMPWEYQLSWNAKDNRHWDAYAYTRPRRPHMTPAVKGRWHVNVDEGGKEAPEEGEMDWVTESPGAERQREEVALADIAKPGRRRRQGKKCKSCRSAHLLMPTITPLFAAGDFEVVPGSRSVIVLDDYELPEPSVNEPWECLDLDDEDRETSQKPSYAEVVANPTA